MEEKARKNKGEEDSAEKGIRTSGAKGDVKVKLPGKQWRFPGLPHEV